MKDQNPSGRVVWGVCSTEDIGADHVYVVAPGDEGSPILLDVGKPNLEHRAFGIFKKRSGRFVVQEVDKEA